ncbi:MAG: NmrA family NAD(P)-binding protein [Pseudomonadota bacterium]
MSDTRRILVTGATGRIGQETVRMLQEEYGLTPRVLVRDADKARQMFPSDVEMIVGDFSNSAALDKAIEGMDAILLNSPVNPAQREWQSGVARAAAKAGEPYIVKISGLGTALDSYVDSGRWHAEIEEDIRNLELPFTFLRPYFFMQNLGFQFNMIRQQGILRSAVEDAQISMVDVRDIAAVSAKLLAGEAELAGKAVPLTSREVLTYPDIANMLSDVLGRDVKYVQQSLQELSAMLEKSGQPAWHIEILMQFNRAFADGWACEPHKAVEQVLGRLPRTLRNYFEELAQVPEKPAGHDPFPS